jgi:hypothetical protein
VTGLSGRFETRVVVWHDVDVSHCEVCGRLLLRRVWVFDDPDRGQILACGAECEQLWFTYLRARLQIQASPQASEPRLRS